jgi:site-specific DNA recombinase
MSKVIIYARYSSDMQSPLSVEDQIALCRKTAEGKGWQVVDVFSDEALTGKKKDRPGFKKLKDALCQGVADVVMFESLDRLSRSLEHSAGFYKIAEHNRVKLYAVDTGFLDLLRLGLQALMAQEFLTKLGQKTRRGIEGKVMRGESGGGRSYGYRIPVDANDSPIKGAMEIDGDEAAIVRRIFREYAAGVSPQKIAAQLNAEFIPSPRAGGKGSGHWKQNTINGNRLRGTGILNNELYVGRRVWNRVSYSMNPETEQTETRLNPETDWVVNEVPHLRIVPQDDWEAVKARQKRQDDARDGLLPKERRGLRVNQGLRRPKYLLSGLIRCGSCGGTMTVAGGTKVGGARRYYCANAKEKGPAVCAGMPGILQSEVEESVLSGLRDGLMQPDAYAKFREDYRIRIAGIRDVTAETIRIKDRQINEHKRRLDGLIAAVESGEHSAVLIRQLNKLDAELGVLVSERAKIEPTKVDFPDNLAELYRSYVENLAATYSEGTVLGRAGDELRNLVTAITIRWDAEARSHAVEIEGKLLEMLQKANPAGEAGYVAEESSLKLVAGAGFEPAAFRL